MPAALFLTGGTGFVGRRLLPGLVADGHAVRALHRPGTAGPDFATLPGSGGGGVEWVAGDLERPRSYADALEGVATVVHLAALTGRARAARFDAVNRDGTRGLLDAAARHGVDGFLFVSTIAVNFPSRARYPYARSKAAAEELVRLSGLGFAVARPTMVFGPGSPVLAGLAALARLPVLPLVGGGRAPVQPIWVDDLCLFLRDLINGRLFDGQTVELGGPRALPIADLLGELRRRAGRHPGPRLALPAAPLAALLTAAEVVAGPRLPLTVGQLQSLLCDGTAAASPLWEQRRERLKGIAAMLDGSVPR